MSDVGILIFTQAINKIKKNLRDLSREVKDLRNVVKGFDNRLKALEAFVSGDPGLKLPGDLQLTQILNIIKDMYNDGLVDEYDDVIVVDVHAIVENGGWNGLKPSDVIATLRRNRKLKKVPDFVKGEGRIALSIEEMW